MLPGAEHKHVEVVLGFEVVRLELDPLVAAVARLWVGKRRQHGAAGARAGVGIGLRRARDNEKGLATARRGMHSTMRIASSRKKAD